MRKNLFKIVTIILSIIFVILVITLVSMKVVNGKEKENREILLSKITDELNFIDYNVIDAMNRLNNITVTRYKIYTKTVNNGDDTDHGKSVENGANKKSEGQQDNSQGSQSSGEGGAQNGSNSGGASNQGGQSQSSGGNSSSGDSQSQGTGGGNSSSGSSLGGTGNSTNQSSNNKSEKESEMRLVNSLTETDNDEPDWDTITNIYENLLSTWPTIQLDLKKAGIGDEYLDNINVSLNGVAQSILNKDKNSSLVNFYNVYSQLPTYTSIVSTDEYNTNLYNTKKDILNAYTLANNDNKWNEITNSVKSASKQFEKIVDSKNDKKEKDNLEKVQSMLKNLESTVALNNKNIFYMQYKNVMQEISNL